MLPYYAVAGCNAIDESLTLPSTCPLFIFATDVFMAAAGSTLCGRHVCSPGQICMDDAVCCNPGSNVCGEGAGMRECEFKAGIVLTGSFSTATFYPGSG